LAIDDSLTIADWGLRHSIDGLLNRAIARLTEWRSAIVRRRGYELPRVYSPIVIPGIDRSSMLPIANRMAQSRQIANRQ